MLYAEHGVPHFHARYGTDEVVVGIQDLTLLSGSLPPRALGMVLEWATRNREALEEDWGLLRNSQPPRPIPPLQ